MTAKAPTPRVPASGKKRRRLIAVQTYAHGKGEGQTFSGDYQLAMQDATATEAENAAVRIMRAVNVQLEMSQSHIRLVAFDTKEQKWLKVKIPS